MLPRSSSPASAAGSITGGSDAGRTVTTGSVRAERISTRDAVAARPPEVVDLLATLGVRPARGSRPLGVRDAARLMLELADRSVEHTGEVMAAAAAAGIRGLDVLPGRRAYTVCCLIDLYGPQSPGAIAAHVERSAATATASRST